jgi:hypothetical protein
LVPASPRFFGQKSQKGPRLAPDGAIAKGAAGSGGQDQALLGAPTSMTDPSKPDIYVK